MPAASFSWTNFLGGEWSNSAQGRYDLPAYKTAMNVCTNGLPIETGAWTRRPGTAEGGISRQGKPSRPIAFPFEQAFPYTVEFTDGFVRFWSGTARATTNDSQAIASISAAKPAIIQTANPHGWASGNAVFFSALGANNPLLQNRVFQITVIDATHFSIVDEVTLQPIDGSTLGAFVSGKVNRVQEVATPYTAGAWANIRKVQAENQAILLHPNFQPQVISVTTSPAAGVFAQFSIAPLSLIDGPYLGFVSDATMTSSGLSGSVTLAVSSITKVNSGQGFLSTDVGRLVRLFSQPAQYVTGNTYAVGNAVTYLGLPYTALAAGTLPPPNTNPSDWAVDFTKQQWSWLIITSVTDTSHVVATVQAPNNLLVTSFNDISWELGLYSSTTGWPSCGTYHEGRLWLAGSQPNRIDGSTTYLSGAGVPNGLGTFSPTTLDGTSTVTSANAISYVFNAPDVNPILWMEPDQQGIICGTLKNEWLVQATAINQPLTPTSIQAHRVTTHGSPNIATPAARTEHTIVFIQRYSRKVMEYFSDVFSGKFSAPHLTEKAKHLTYSGLQEIAYQQELDPVIWCRRGDGNFIGGTYKRDTLMTSQGPTFVGWHLHILGSNRSVKGICVGPSTDGTLDALTMTTLDPATGLYHIEVLTNRMEDDTPQAQAWYVDAGIVPSSGVSTPGVGITFNGLWSMNNESVAAVVGGLDCGNYTVANGSIFVPFKSDPDGLFTNAYLQQLMSNPNSGATFTCSIDSGQLVVPVVVGFPYESDGQLMRPQDPREVGTPTGPGLGKVRRIHQFSVLMQNCVKGSISFGGDFNHLHVAQLRTPGGTPIANAAQMYNGIHWDTLDDTYSFDSMIAWRIARPQPAMVIAVGAFLQGQER